MVPVQGPTRTNWNMCVCVFLSCDSLYFVLVDLFCLCFVENTKRRTAWSGFHDSESDSNNKHFEDLAMVLCLV